MVEEQNVDDLEEESTTTDLELSEEKTAEIVIDGKTYTSEEILRLEEKGSNLQRDYTQKTQKLAEDKDSLQKEKEDILSIRDKNLETQRALQNDLNFYKTHPPAEWDGYTSEVDQVLGKATPGEKREVLSDPRVKALIDKVEGLEKKLTGFEERDVDKDYNNALGIAKSLISKTYPLAPFDSIKDKIQIFHAYNKRLPSEEEVKGIVSARHDEAVKLNKKMGFKVDEETKEKGGILPSGAGGGLPGGKTLDEVKVSRIEDHGEAGKKFMENQILKRGG